MWAEYKNTLRKMQGALIGWGVGLFAYTFMMGALFPMLVTDMGAEYLQIVEMVPQEFLAFFPNITLFLSPVGYSDTYFFSLMVVVIPILSIGQGAKLLVRDEEEGILDLAMSYPLSRAKLFWARAAAYLVGLALVLLASYLGWLLPDKSDAWTMTAWELARAHFPLLAIAVLFGALAFLFSLLLPSLKAASGLTGALLVSNYLLLGIANMRDELKALYDWTPLRYYQGGLAADDFNWGWFLGLCGVSLVFLLAAWLLFERRDLRVGGEAGWQMPAWLKPKTGS